MPPPPLLDMFRALVAVPSVSSVNPIWDQSNEGVIDLLAEWTGDLGLRVEKLAVPAHPGKLNLIATAGEGSDGLVLSGHTDTVPFDAQRWTSDPFRLTEKAGRLYGLGAADMKGFFACAIEVLKELDLSRLRQPLILLATADEESNMCGARALLASGRTLGRQALIGEPTGLRPVRMHKGISMEAVRLTGRSGHSSNPALGNNALEGMHLVIAELLAWRAELQARYRNPRFEIPVPTLNLGAIHGGDNPNRICGQCELDYDLRPLPGMDLDALRAEIGARLARRLADSGLKLETLSLFEGIPALETSADAAIVRAAEAYTGCAAEAVAFGTEAPYLAGLGAQPLILGPGDIEQAHQPDEYLTTERLGPFMDLLRRLVQRFCY